MSPLQQITAYCLQWSEIRDVQSKMHSSKVCNGIYKLWIKNSTVCEVLQFFYKDPAIFSHLTWQRSRNFIFLQTLLLFSRKMTSGKYNTWSCRTSLLRFAIPQATNMFFMCSRPSKHVKIPTLISDLVKRPLFTKPLIVGFLFIDHHKYQRLRICQIKSIPSYWNVALYPFSQKYEIATLNMICIKCGKSTLISAQEW